MPVSCHLTEVWARIHDTGNATLFHPLIDFSREQPGTIINPRRTYSQFTRLGSKWQVLCSHVSPFPLYSKLCWWVPTRTKQLSMATSAGMIWLCACVRYLSTGHNWPSLLAIPRSSTTEFGSVGIFSFWVWSYRYFQRITTLDYLIGLFNIALF